MAATRSKPAAATKAGGTAGGSHAGVSKKTAPNQRSEAQKGVKNAANSFDKADPKRQQDLEEQLHFVDGKNTPEGMNVDNAGEDEESFKQEEQDNQEGMPDRSDAAPEGANSTPEPREETAAEAGRSNRGGAHQPPIQHNDDGPELVAGLMGGLSVEDEHEVQGIINRAWKHKYAIVRHGPRNSPKYLFSNDEPFLNQTDKWLDKQSESTRKANNISAGKGRIVSIRGLVWDPMEGLNRYESLAPRNWYGGERAKRPRMRIRTRWEGLDEPLWEKYATVEKRWQNINTRKGEDEKTKTVLVDADVRIGDTVVLEQGERVRIVDRDIVLVACECERLYDAWKDEGRVGRDETPELHPPSK